MTVLNKHKHGIPEGAVYIGRGSKWGNPFVIGKDGTREEVVEKFRLDLIRRIRSGGVTLEELAELDGKALVCFCAPQACHGHILERFAKQAAIRLKTSASGSAK